VTSRWDFCINSRLLCGSQLNRRGALTAVIKFALPDRRLLLGDNQKPPTGRHIEPRASLGFGRCLLRHPPAQFKISAPFVILRHTAHSAVEGKKSNIVACRIPIKALLLQKNHQWTGCSWLTSNRPPAGIAGWLAKAAGAAQVLCLCLSKGSRATQIQHLDRRLGTRLQGSPTGS
jgi:hypothetical protein